MASQQRKNHRDKALKKAGRDALKIRMDNERLTARVAELEHAEEALDKAMPHIEWLEGKLGEYQSAINVLKNTVAEYQSAINVLKNTVAERDAEITRLTAADKDAATLRRRLQNKTAEITALQTELSKVRRAAKEW
jgi:DNA repair ATPase RecN